MEQHRSKCCCSKLLFPDAPPFGCPIKVRRLVSLTAQYLLHLMMSQMNGMMLSLRLLSVVAWKILTLSLFVMSLHMYITALNSLAYICLSL
eukprot:jgi/Chrzof1/7433/Cz02g23150.t1